MKVTIQDSRTSVTVEPRDFRVTVSGARGPQGIGIAAGGAEGQILAKASATDYDTEWIDNYAVNVEVYVKNSSGSPMTKGQVVYISGADGTNPTISLAIATSEMGSSKTIGWLKQDLVQGAFGYVITEGLLEGINTNSATAAGDPVWLSPTTAGGVVYGLASKPSAPNHLVFLGYVLRKQTNNGKVYVKVQNGFELGELHDVYNGAKTTPVGGDALLLRDSADNNLWKRLTWTNALAGVKSHMDTFKSIAGGYASLDGSGKVPSSELPSYVDDVVEAANYAALPVTGETGKIYVTLDTNKCYRWSGSVYVQVAQGIDTLTTIGTSGAATLVGSTLNIPQYQGVLTNPVTGTGTAGQVAYFNGTSAVTGSSSLVWDNTNFNLGVNRTPIVSLDISTTANTTITGLNIIPNVSTSVLIGNTGTNSVLAIGQNNTAQAWLQSRSRLANQPANALLINPLGGNVLINNTDGTGRLTVRGSGTNSATTALLVQNSTPANLLTVTDDGRTAFGSSASSVLVYPSGTSDNSLIGGDSLTFNVRGNINSQTQGGVTFSGDTSIITSGNHNVVAIRRPFSPTSGSAGYRFLSITPQINQTGSANGVTRGLYVNPELLAAADWRSIEWSNNTGWGLYGAGTANNYLAGSLGIGTTSLTGSSLIIQRQITGGINPLTVTARGSIQSDATGNVRYFNVATFSAAATFTTNKIIAYEAEQGSLGLGHTVLEQIGFQATGSLTGATNNYGFYGNIASGTNRWNLYMNGTAANYLAGNTSIGTTTSGGRLTVQGETTTSASNGFLVEDSAGVDVFTVRNDGGYAFKGGTVGLAQTGYTTFTNLTTDRTCNANATTVEELADILGTLIEDLKTKGIIAA